jgi:AcrR family transcriptional regulator
MAIRAPQWGTKHLIIGGAPALTRWYKVTLIPCVMPSKIKHSKTERSTPGAATPLDRDRIARTALSVLDKNGLSGFTMRRMAGALGVTPMALYHHVQNKAELAALIVHASTLAHPLASPTGDWREDLWAMAQWTREAALAHPSVQELRRTYRVYTQDILRMAERWLSLWQQSGLDLDKAVIAATTSSLAIAGAVAEETIFRNLDRPDKKLTMHLPNARLLLESKYDPVVMFELAVRALIDGLHARLMREGEGTLQLASLKSKKTRRRTSRPAGRP